MARWKPLPGYPLPNQMETAEDKCPRCGSEKCGYPLTDMTGDSVGVCMTCGHNFIKRPSPKETN
jgi:DNA-directed RNA polymerase subunit RPC12/RpoP